MFDLVIIGAGPAGISAAIHAKRFDLNCVVLERGAVGGQARAANWITNYPGFPNGISGRELTGLFARQAEAAGVRIERCEVTRVSLRGVCHSRPRLKPSGVIPAFAGTGGNPVRSRDLRFCGDDIFNVATSHGIFESHLLILATGLEPIQLPYIDAIYYPVPDDIPHEGKSVLVIGGGDSAFDEALSFSKKAASVTIAMRGDRPRAPEGLVRRANEAGIKIAAGMTGHDIARFEADITVACCGKRRNKDLLDDVLLTTDDQRPANLQLAGDIAHPNVRHIAVAAGDGIRAVEGLASQGFLLDK
jgi:thioredoxin reductase